MSQKTFFNSKDARHLINVYGFALHPLHGVVDGQCTCGDINCTNQGKHPATQNGLKDATKDIESLKALWAARPHLNVGIATGEASGVFVIDIDGPEGEESLKLLGALPPTLTAETARGRHLFFKHPGKQVITKRGILEKIDVRGDGGYVAGPGSNHITGKKYQWINPLEQIAEAPDEVLQLVVKDRIKPKPLPVGLGGLHNPYTPANSSLFKPGLSIDQVNDMLNYINPDLGYDEWINIGMAIQSEGFPFAVWDNWSRGGTKYDGHNIGSHWKSFKPGGGVTLGTLVHLAKQGGWQHASEYKPLYHLPQPPPKETEETGREILDKETGEVHTLDPTMYYIKASDIHENLDTADFVQGLLSEGAFSVVYGESNCGKTFFMADLCFHVALGREWRGKRVEQGGVIYVALEGSYGLKNRVAAFKKHYGLVPANFAIVPCPVDFMDPEGNINKFIQMLRIAKADLGNVKLIVIDTLARALTGGDENSGQDMGMLVHHADRIRYETGAHVCFIHHSGKDRARGARGHSSLRAAVDTEIEISRDPEAEYSRIKIVKQREMEMINDMYFRLELIELGHNKHNEPITSCAVMPISEENIIEPRHSSDLPSMQQFVYDALLRTMIEYGSVRSPEKDMPAIKCVTYDQLKDALEAAGFSEMIDPDKAKSTTQSARFHLKKKGLINFNRKFLWLNTDEQEEGF